MNTTIRLSNIKCQSDYSELSGNSEYEVMQNPPMHDKEARTVIANWLKSALDSTKVSQTELGRRINLDQSKISKICTEDRGMSARELLAVAEALKVPLPSIGQLNPTALQASDSEEYSDLALDIIRELEKTKFSGDMPHDDYIEASAVIFSMLRSSGGWYPDLFKISIDMIDKVQKDKSIRPTTFTDYVKSVAVHYRTLVSANNTVT